MSWVCVVLIWSLQTRTEKLFSYSISHSYSNLKVPNQLWATVFPPTAEIFLRLVWFHFAEKRSRKKWRTLSASNLILYLAVSPLLEQHFKNRSFNIFLTVFAKTCLEITLRMSHWPGEIWPPPWLGENPPRKHVTGTSPAGCHVNTKHSRELKELNKHSQ